MHRFRFLMFAVFFCCAGIPSGRATTLYEPPRGSDECYDSKGMAKPDTTCICMVQKYACGPASTCGAKVCQSVTCAADQDCKVKFGPTYHCKAQQCTNK